MESQEYEALLAPRDPAYTEPDEEVLGELQIEVADIAAEFAKRISVRSAQFAAGGPAANRLHEALDFGLSYLRILREFGPAAEAIAAEEARNAGLQGATYPQLGAAWGISRQSARKKWPDAMRPVSGSVPESREIEMAGGNARIGFDPAAGGWDWFATGANTAYAESETSYDTSEEAAAHAGVWLMANSGPQLTDAQAQQPQHGVHGGQS